MPPLPCGKLAACLCDGSCLRVGLVEAPQPEPKLPGLRYLAGGFDDRERGTVATVRVNCDPLHPVLLDVAGAGAALLRLSRDQARHLAWALSRAVDIYPELDKAARPDGH